MPRYNIRTTVDITRSNPNRDEVDPIKHAQQSNFNTLLQGIGMRSNVDWTNDPYMIETDGDTAWIWTFEAEQVDVFLKDQDPVGLLKEDLNGVPIIRNLTNTAPLDKPVFLVEGEDQNIWISAE